MRTLSRRRLLQATGCGFGSLAFNALCGTSASAGSLHRKTPPIPARARRVIFLCMPGGPAHLDTFDYKPQTGKTEHPGPAFQFSQHGESGLRVSELYPDDRKRVV